MNEQGISVDELDFAAIGRSLAHHETFVFLAETLAGWLPPSTPRGREVLEQHYRWGHRLRDNGTILFAGPVDVDAMGPGAPGPVGRITGLLVVRAASREAAEAIARQEPFHVAGFRNNVVHAWSIRFLQPEIDASLATALARPVA